MHVPHYHEGSVTTQICCHSLITLLVLSMAAIFYVPLYHIAIHHIGIERVSFHKLPFFACDFDLQFIFCYTGWEGSATDAHVFKGGLQAGLQIPNGYYYLADMGYLPSYQDLLTPYHGSGTILPSGAGLVKSH